jgi:hypothetical protein
MRESRSSGSVRGGDGNVPTYSAPGGAGSAARGGGGLGALTTVGTPRIRLRLTFRYAPDSERESEHRGASALGHGPTYAVQQTSGD